MKKLSHIEWAPSNSVHVETIDAQHSKLFDITNQLIDVFESGSDDLLPVINGLVQYLTYHFREESSLMMKVDYPDFKSHSQEHMKFIEQVHDFIKKYSENNRDLAFDMIVFLRDWVRDHTFGVDIQYGIYMVKNNKIPDADEIDRQ